MLNTQNNSFGTFATQIGGRRKEMDRRGNREKEVREVRKEWKRENERAI